MSNSILVIYHLADFDGLCSCEIARKALGDTADYLGWDYSRPIPDLLPYETVYLIDISLPPAVMAKHAHRLIWIDHHISKIREMEGVPIRGYRIDGVAACRLAWQWFNSRSECDGVDGLGTKQDYIVRRVTEPYAVQLLGEYDIWDKRNPDTDPFQLGMQAQKSPDWSLLFSGGPGSCLYIDSVIVEGRTIQRYTEVTNAEVITERGFDVVFAGHTFRALNTARCNSMTFTAAIQPHHEGCLAYRWNGKKWGFSLYQVEHRKDIDLSLIAAKFGGGGHRGACGFELDELPVELGGVAR